MANWIDLRDFYILYYVGKWKDGDKERDGTEKEDMCVKDELVR